MTMAPRCLRCVVLSLTAALLADSFVLRHRPFLHRHRTASVVASSQQDPDAVAAAAAAVAARRAASSEQTAWDRIVQQRLANNGSDPIGAHDRELGGEEGGLSAIGAPLKFMGPYPAIALSFPDLATPAQVARGDKGVTLDFVVDTAANTNTINSVVASELNLQRVGTAPSGVGAGGAIAGGATYMLGDVELGDVPAAERFRFMGGLTASALPVASPAAAGILGAPFLFSFRGGVEFVWGPQATPPQQPQQPQATQPSGFSLLPLKGLGGKSLFDESGEGEEQKEAGTTSEEAAEATSSSPSFRFFNDLGGIEEVTSGLKQVPCEQLPSGLVKVELTINGVLVPALLDTGSPITVLNAAAAEAVGLEVPPSRLPATPGQAGEKKNPLTGFMDSVKAAQAAASGEVLLIAGSDGAPVELRRAAACGGAALGDADLLVASSSADSTSSEPLRCYIGDLPGLAALNGLGASAGPAAVLGTDFLRRRDRLVLVNGEVFV